MKFFGLYRYMIPHNFGVHVLAHTLMEKHSRWLQKVESTGRCLDFSFFLVGRQTPSGMEGRKKTEYHAAMKRNFIN